MVELQDGITELDTDSGKFELAGENILVQKQTT